MYYTFDVVCMSSVVMCDALPGDDYGKHRIRKLSAVKCFRIKGREGGVHSGSNND